MRDGYLRYETTLYSNLSKDHEKKSNHCDLVDFVDYCVRILANRNDERRTVENRHHKGRLFST